MAGALALTAPVPGYTFRLALNPVVDQGTPGQGRGRKATGSLPPPRRQIRDATRDPKIAELPNG